MWNKTTGDTYILRIKEKAHKKLSNPFTLFDPSCQPLQDACRGSLSRKNLLFFKVQVSLLRLRETHNALQLPVLFFSFFFSFFC